MIPNSSRNCVIHRELLLPPLMVNPPCFDHSTVMSPSDLHFSYPWGIQLRCSYLTLTWCVCTAMAVASPMANSQFRVEAGKHADMLRPNRRHARKETGNIGMLDPGRQSTRCLDAVLMLSPTLLRTSFTGHSLVGNRSHYMDPISF
jgi:hypothetical protein